MTTRRLLDSGDLVCTASLKLLDLRQREVADITDRLVAGTSVVSRRSYGANSSRAEYRCEIAEDLPWTSALLAPSMTVASEQEGLSETWPMGVYLPDVADKPRAFASGPVVGHDLLHVLDSQIDASIRAAAGANVLDLVRSFVTSSVQLPEFELPVGFGASAATFAHEAIWAVTETETYLSVCNEMLGFAGYRPLWTGRSGEVFTEEAALLVDRRGEWLIDGDAGNGQIGDESRVLRDYFSTPNVWIAAEVNPSAGVPTEGVGVHRIENTMVGPTSISVRGRRKNRRINTDASSAEALARATRAEAEADVAASERLDLFVPPLPFVWHLARVTVNDRKLGLSHVPGVVRDWTLPLDAENARMRLGVDRLYRVVLP